MSVKLVVGPKPPLTAYPLPVPTERMPSSAPLVMLLWMLLLDPAVGSIFLSINLNRPHTEVIPVYDALVGPYFPLRAFKVPNTSAATEWARNHTEYRVDFMPTEAHSNGWRQHLSLLDSMRRYDSTEIEGYLHTNDDVFFHLGAINKLNRSKYWSSPCYASQLESTKQGRRR